MKRVSITFSLLFAFALVFGQYDPRENFYDAEFFFAEEDYSEALYAFNQVYKEGYQDNANINYRIGVCMLNIDERKKESIPYLEKAAQSTTDKYKEGNFKEVNAPMDVFLYLGNAYRIDMQFDKAIESYKKFNESLGGGMESEYANLQIQACEKAKASKKSLDDYSFGTLGQVNQIKAPIYNVTVSGDLKTLAFMGKQKFYNGVYICRNVDGKWTRPYNITPSIQSDGDQTVLALSHDGNKLLLTWADQFESEIFVTEFKNKRWYPSSPVGRPINSKYYESHACFSPDGNTIYFTSNRKESLGDMDIFLSTMNADGTWGEAQTLGPNVNTTLSEDNPYVSPDGKRLYFSSQGHEGFGGFDIFYCDIMADGSYGEPVNLGYSLNTTDDDFAFSPKNIEWDDYITLYAKGEEDQVDIFRFELVPDEAQPVVVAFLPEEEEAVEEVVEEPVVEVVEEVVEEAVEELVEEPEPIKEVVAVVESKTHKIKPVYFAFDSWDLSLNAQKKLDDLSKVLNTFPKLELSVIGYTDSQGPDVYNVYLSEMRATAVRDYLKGKGISEERMEISAKGETDPVAADTFQGRPFNRRVQFKAKVPGKMMIEIDDSDIPVDLRLK